MLKLYVLIMESLTEGQQAVQAGHALAQFASDHPERFEDWQSDSNTLIYLNVRDIDYWQTILEDGEMEHSVFHEPDLYTWSEWSSSRGLDTAIAVAPNWACQYVLFKDLPLAFQPKSPERKWWRRG